MVSLPSKRFRDGASPLRELCFHASYLPCLHIFDMPSLHLFTFLFSFGFNFTGMTHVEGKTEGGCNKQSHNPNHASHYNKLWLVSILGQQTPIQNQNKKWRPYKVRGFLAYLCKQGKNWPPSANQGISTDSHYSYHVHVTLRVFSKPICKQGKNWTTQCQPRHFYRQPPRACLPVSPCPPVPPFLLTQNQRTSAQRRSFLRTAQCDVNKSWH